MTLFRRLQPTDLKDTRALEQYIRGLERSVEDLQRTVEGLRSTSAANANVGRSLSQDDLFAIKAALEAGGVAQLDLTNIPGLIAESTDVRFPIVDTAPDPYTAPYDTYVLNTTPNSLWRIDRTTNPPTAIQIGLVANHNLLSATHTDTTAGTVVLGDLIAGDGTPKWVRVAGNITTTRQFLAQTGTGAVSAAPTWVTPSSADLSDVATIMRVNTAISLGNGASVNYGYVTELLTLNTAALFTDTTADLPNIAFIKGVLAYVQTGITGPPTVYRVGDPTTTDRFGSDDANLGIGNSRICFNHLKGGVASDAAGPTQTTSAKVRVTLDAVPTAGKIRLVWHYEKYVPPTS